MVQLAESLPGIKRVRANMPEMDTDKLMKNPLHKLHRQGLPDWRERLW